MKWLLICKQHYNENTAEYGFGDYPERIAYLRLVIEADSLRKAQNQIKKQIPRIKFGGRFSPMVVEATPENIEVWNANKPADRRLGEIAAYNHEWYRAILAGK